MQINIKSYDKGDYLLLVTKSKLSVTAHLFLNADKIYLEISKFKRKKILIDQTNTTYPKSLFAYSDLVNYYSTGFPATLKDLTVAIVIAEEYKLISEFWETVCHNKGFKFRAFATLQEAKDWLLS